MRRQFRKPLSHIWRLSRLLSSPGRAEAELKGGLNREPLEMHEELRESLSRIWRLSRFPLVHSTVSAIRNGADLLIAEAKSKVVSFTPGRGFSWVFR